MDVLVERTLAAPSKHSTIDIWLNGGAIERVGESDTAFRGRGNRYVVNPEANWEHEETTTPTCRGRGASSRRSSRMRRRRLSQLPRLPRGGPEPRSRQSRLELPPAQALKQRLDPENVFRRNANIEPENQD